MISTPDGRTYPGADAHEVVSWTGALRIRPMGMMLPAVTGPYGRGSWRCRVDEKGGPCGWEDGAGRRTVRALLWLLHSARSVELKLTIPDPGIRSAAHALGIRPVTTDQVRAGTVSGEKVDVEADAKPGGLACSALAKTKATEADVRRVITGVSHVRR